MKLSVIIPFLNSHELVRRQILWFKKMDLPDEVEILFMDDGSDPPLRTDDPPRNFAIHATNDFRPWTSSLARNRAAKIAKGDYFLMTDGDYIVPKEAILRCLEYQGDKLRFRREFGVLDEFGNLTQDHAVLIAHGLPAERLAEKGTQFPPHPNNFCMRRETFFLIGGYDETRILSRPYPQGEDRGFKRAWAKLVEAGKVHDDGLDPVDNRPTIYMIPNGQWGGDVDHNPLDQYGKPLMHTLSRKTVENHWYTHPRPGVKGIEDDARA